VELVYAEEYDRITDAYAREKQVQNWSRAKREALINGKPELLSVLAKKRFYKHPPLVSTLVPGVSIGVFPSTNMEDI
jgi:putative endonuclease